MKVRGTLTFIEVKLLASIAMGPMVLERNKKKEEETNKQTNRQILQMIGLMKNRWVGVKN